MKHKVLFHPEDYRIGENERFYTDMAARGWRLLSRGRSLSRFEQAAPSDEVYRVEIDYNDFDDERLAVYADCGWEFVTKRNYVNVLRASAGAEPPELYPDPREQAETVRQMRRRDLAANLILLPVTALFLAAVLSLGGGCRDVGDNMLKTVILAPGIAALLLGSLLYALGISIEGGIRVRALYRRLKRGEPLDHTPKKRPMIHKWIYLVTVLLCVGVTAAQLAALDRGDLPEESGGAYIMLDDLGFHGERFALFHSAGENRLERAWSPLAEVVQTRECVREGEDWVSLDQEIYRLRAEFLAEPFADVLIRDSVFSRDPSEYEDIAVPGWNRVRAASMECVALRGGDVVRLYILLPESMTREEKTAVYTRALELIGRRFDGTAQS